MIYPNTTPTLIDIHKKYGIRPAFDIYIGRHVDRVIDEFPTDSKWANHFGTDLDAYENHVLEDLWDDLDELEGKKLGCWCVTTDQVHPTICHGQVLMKLYVVRKKVQDGMMKWGIDEK